FPSRRPPSGARPPIDEHRAFVAEQKEILVSRAKEFLQTYYWLGDSQSQSEPGVFRTHYGLISKKGGRVVSILADSGHLLVPRLGFNL
ncbi:hypothetical protein LJB99_02600, partial [Deltaproteobacteria bacterium OttesenSCG-928-K17]|nr:hypothetical protein [Deltaproteobacteria bacterium OttesenSCG-928-K17]